MDLGAPDVWAYVNLGRVFYDKGLYEESRTCFFKALEIKEQMPQALSGVGMTLAAERKWHDAIGFFARALRIDDRSIESLTGIALSSMGAGNLRAARKFLNKALRYFGDDSRLYCALGIINLFEGKFSDAKNNLLRADAIKTDYYFPSLLLAGVEMVEKSFQSGYSRIENAFNSGLYDSMVVNSAGVNALKQNTVKSSYFRRIGESGDMRERLWGLKNGSVVDVELRNYRRAKNRLKSVLIIKPDFASAYADLGYVCCRLGEPEEAISSLKAAASIEPDNYLWREWIAFFFFERGNFIEASKAAEEAFQLNPGCWACQLMKGICVFESGDRENAITTIKQALSVAPDHGLSPFEHALKGSAFIKMGAVKRAIGEFNKAIQLDPANALYFSLRGAAYLTLGNYKKAASSYRNCLKLDPDNKTSRINLVRLLAEEGKCKEARKELETGLKRNPEEMDYLLELVRCLVKSKSYGAACDSINEVLSSQHLDDALRVEFFILEGLAFNGLGQKEKSIEAYHSALVTDPMRGDAWFYLGEALESLERVNDAIEAYRKAVECSTSQKRWSDLKQKAIRRITILEKKLLQESDTNPLHISDFRSFCVVKAGLRFFISGI